MTYGLQIFGGENPDEKVVFSTAEGDSFLKKQHRQSFTNISASTATVYSSIPDHLNRDNAVICVSITNTTGTGDIVGNVRAIFTGPDTLSGAGEVTICQSAPAGTISGYFEIMQYDDLPISEDAFGLLVTNEDGDLVIDHEVICWGVQYGGILEDQSWFGYENNGGEYCEYRIQELPAETFAINQTFGIAVGRDNPREWTVQPDFISADGTFFSAIRFHRKRGENSNIRFLLLVPGDEVIPPISNAENFGLEIYGPETNAEIGWSSRWEQAIVKHVHEMNTGWDHTPASPVSNYDVEPGYDGVDHPVAASTGGYSESSESLRSRGRWSRITPMPNPSVWWPFPHRIDPSISYTLFSTGAGYVQHYKGMKTKDGVNVGLEGGGIDTWSTTYGWSGYHIGMTRLGDGPDPSGPGDYCDRAFPSYHPTGHAVFLSSTYRGPILPPSKYCVTGRNLDYDDTSTNWYYSEGGLIPYNYNAFTLVFCIKPTLNGGTAWTDIFFADPENYAFNVWYYTDGDVGLDVALTDGGSLTVETTNTPLVDGEWNSIYICAELDNTAQTAEVHIYVNGVSCYSETAEDVLGSGDFVGHTESTVGGAVENVMQGDPTDISYVWCDDSFLHPTTYYQVFFDSADIPQNIGLNGDEVQSNLIPLNFFPDGSFVVNYGQLVDTAGYSEWQVEFDGWVLESETNPTGCPKRLDGGDRGPTCVTGRSFDSSSENYYTSEHGFINDYHNGMAFIVCLKPKGASSYDGFWYAGEPDESNNYPFFIGQKANGDFWIGFRTNAGENISWTGDILTDDQWNSLFIMTYIYDQYDQVVLEIYNNGGQAVRVFFNDITGTEFLPHDINGGAYLAANPLTAGQTSPTVGGVDIDISYILVYDKYWYAGDYWQEFFDVQNRPYPFTNEDFDDKTGTTPVVFLPRASVIQNVQILPSTWTVHGYVPESRTNPSGCDMKHDGGDGIYQYMGGKTFGYGDSSYREFVQFNTSLWESRFDPDPESGSLRGGTLVFCIRPHEYPSTTDTDTQVPIMAEDGYSYGNVGFVYDNTDTELKFEAYFDDYVYAWTPATKLTLNQWNAVMITVRHENVSGSLTRFVELWINGVKEAEGSNTTNYSFYDGDYWTIGKTLAKYQSENAPAKFDLTFFWADDQYLNPVVYWDRFFDESNIPRLIGMHGDTITNKVPLRFYPEADFSYNNGRTNWMDQAIVSPARNTDVIPDSSTDPWGHTVDTAGWDNELKGSALMPGRWVEEGLYPFAYTTGDWDNWHIPYISSTSVKTGGGQYPDRTCWVEFQANADSVDSDQYSEDNPQIEFFDYYYLGQDYLEWNTWLDTPGGTVSTGEYIIKFVNVTTTWPSRITVGGTTWKSSRQNTWMEIVGLQVHCFAPSPDPDFGPYADYTTTFQGNYVIAKAIPGTLLPEEGTEVVGYISVHAQSWSPY